MGRLEGKVAIVTGAGRPGNIGVAIGEAFLREGARGVVATDFRTDARTEIAALMGPGAADRLVQVKQDVTSEADWQRVLSETLERFGQLDILVNNAGISVHGGIADTSLDDLRRVMAVNHDALFLGIKICAPALATAKDRFAGGGSIINNLSMASYMPNATNIGYHVSKAAGRMLTICAALEYGPQTIRVNSVHPGVTMTPLIREGLAAYVSSGMWETEEAAEAALAAMNPLGIASQPDDTASAFVYLASDESCFVTGASLCHDGGIGMRY